MTYTAPPLPTGLASTSMFYWGMKKWLIIPNPDETLIYDIANNLWMHTSIIIENGWCSPKAKANNVLLNIKDGYLDDWQEGYLSDCSCSLQTGWSGLEEPQRLKSFTRLFINAYNCETVSVYVRDNILETSTTVLDEEDYADTLSLNMVEGREISVLLEGADMVVKEIGVEYIPYRR